MKYLLAFALIAAASALPEPIRLLQPVELAQPDITPLMVPQEVMDQVARLVQFVEEAVNAEEAVYAPESLDAAAYAVNFVDEVAESADASDLTVNVEEVVATAVRVVDAPVESDDAATYAVNVVDEVAEISETEAINDDAQEIDAVLVVDAPVESDASDYSVKIVEAPEVSEDAPVQINTIEIPLPDSVVMPYAEPIVLPTIDAVKIAESPLEANNDYRVKFVDVADVDEETPSYRPLKVYDDARLR